jgi:hypothetical protein
MMATKIYEVETIMLIDGTEIRLTPLKIKYLREFMEVFESVKKSSNDDEAIQFLLTCALVAMKQYYPAIKTIDQLEDTINLPAIYRIIDVAAGIKVNEDNDKESIKDQATESGSTWESLDLAKLESEVFLIGIWKDYEELESSLSMPELVATLGSKRELDYDEKKFLAAIQGVDLDKQSGKNEANAWEKMKAKVFSGGKSSDPNDVVSLQGVNAQKAGFGIGMGISYQDLTKK